MRQEAKALPTFLKCFPNVKTLHVMVGFYSNLLIWHSTPS